MKKILTIVLLSANLAHSESESKLHALTTVKTISAWSATNVVSFVAHNSGLSLEYSDGVQTNAIQFRFQAENLPHETLLNWALHFLNAHATVDGTVLRIVGGSPPTLPDGKPVATSDVLAKSYSQTNTFTHRFDQMIEHVLHVSKFGNVVMGPDSLQFQTKVHLDPKGRSTAEILEDLCDQAGLECTLHSKVLFIRKKK